MWSFIGELENYKTSLNTGYYGLYFMNVKHM